MMIRSALCLVVDRARNSGGLDRIFGSALTTSDGMPCGSQRLGFRTEPPVRGTDFNRTTLRRPVRHPHRRRSLGGRSGLRPSRRMPCQRILVGFAEARNPDERPRRSRLRLVRLVNVTGDCPKPLPRSTPLWGTTPQGNTRAGEGSACASRGPLPPLGRGS